MAASKYERERLAGTVRSLFRDKGFGFIRSADGHSDLFFHRSSVRPGDWERLHDGASVSYRQEASVKGPRAEAVQAES